MDSKNNKINILNYWIDVESSSPPIIKTSNFINKGKTKWNQLISNSRNDDILWTEPLIENIEKPECWLHKVFLGIFNTKLVIEAFSINDVVDIKYTHNTCLVSFLVDGNGMPVKKSIKIPDYLKSLALATIPDTEKAKMFDIRIEDVFATWILSIEKTDGKVETENLKELLQKIVLELNWDLLDGNLINNNFKYLAYSESLNLEVIEDSNYIKFDTNDITSSLIVDDLKNVKNEFELGNTSKVLEQYLSDNFESIEKIDVVKDSEFFRDELDINKLPLVSWPLSGNHSLVSSQQFAVNKIFNSIEENPLLSVNGPPGTGKTTLFKDIISNIIFLRALELIKYKNDPTSAFTKIGDVSWKLNNRNKQSVYQLNKKISGFEIVVASSNNGSVENITKEFPLRNEIDDFFKKDFNYLSEIASNINNKDSWGMISASLGNKNNNYNFFSKFLFSNSKDSTNEVTRSIFDYLNHPNYFDEKRLSWLDACNEFENALQNVNFLKSLSIEKQNKTLKYKASYDKAILLKKEYNNIQNTYNNKSKEFKKKSESLTKLNNAISEKKIAILKIKKNNDFVFNRKKESINKHIIEYNRLVSIKKNTMLELRTIKQKSQKILKDKRKKETEFNKEKVLLCSLKSYYFDYFKNVNSEIPLDSFWSQSYENIQKGSPWISNELNNARKKLFCASINLQKSFLIENNQAIISNLNVFKQILGGNFYEKQIYLKSVWETLFLIVPVLSTTFSSFGKLFNRLPNNSIGWLLIDEAGQATPQSPVGALWRSKRALFVGDPLQVEPVIQIEDKLSDVLLDKNSVDRIWNSVLSSAQEIADRNNPFGTFIDLGIKKWVGMPLRVHRRCDEPMFSISNKIAYNDLMIYGKKRERELSDIEKIIGKTCWFNIEGNSENDSHWIEDEGKKVLELLIEICQSERYIQEYQLPSIYIITPFKNISFELINFLNRNKKQWKPKNINDNDINNWLYKSVGTIHSFQGDEADVVFLVLGGNITKPSAISWVCETPNILNVAVSRARKSFYIIGNKAIWNKGVFGLIRNYIK